MLHQAFQHLLRGKGGRHKEGMCGGIRKGIKTVIAKIDMKVLRRAGLMAMIVELHIARTVAGNGLKLIAHGDFAVIPDIGGIARAGVFGDAQGLPSPSSKEMVSPSTVMATASQAHTAMYFSRTESTVTAGSSDSPALWRKKASS